MADEWQMDEPGAIKIYIHIFIYKEARSVAGRLRESHISRERLVGRGRDGDGEMADASAICAASEHVQV